MAENQIGFEVSAAISRASVTAIRDSVTQAFNRVPISVAIDTASLDRVQKQLSSVAKIPLTLDRAKIIAEAKSIYGEIRQIFGQPVKLGTTGSASSAQSFSGSNNLSGGLVQAVAAAGGTPRDLIRATKAQADETNAVTKATKLQVEENRRLAASQATVSDQLTRTTYKFSNYVAVASLFFNVFRGINVAVRDVQFFNVEVNKLGQILGGNTARAREVSQQVTSVARAYGQSGKEILKVTSLLAQSGNKFQGQGLLNAVNALAQTPLAATFGTLENTTEGVISALNQFNLTGSETIRVLDIANKLSKDYAFQSDDLFTAVQRGGAAFSAVGGSIEEFGAVIATLRQVTGLSAQTLGTGLNTVAIRGLREDVIAFTSELTGGAIYEANGQLKGFTDRLLAVADVFGTLNDIQRGEVIEKLAGIRQGKQLIPLLENPALLKEAIDTAKKSEGDFTKDAVRGLDRVDAQIQRVGTSFQQIFLDLSQNDSIKNLVKDFATLAESVADVVKATGLLGPIASSVVRILGVAGAITATKVVKNSFFALAQNVSRGGVAGVTTAAGVVGTAGGSSASLRGLSSDGSSLSKTDTLAAKNFTQLQLDRASKLAKINGSLTNGVADVNLLRAKLNVRIAEKALSSINPIGVPNKDTLNIASSARILALARAEPQIREKFVNKRGSFLAANLGRVDQDLFRSELMSGSALGPNQRNRVIADAARAFITSTTQNQVLTPQQINEKAKEFVKKNGIDKIPFQFLTAAVDSAKISSNTRLGFISSIVNRQAASEFQKTSPANAGSLLRDARRVAVLDEARRIASNTGLIDKGLFATNLKRSLTTEQFDSLTERLSRSAFRKTDKTGFTASDIAISKQLLAQRAGESIGTTIPIETVLRAGGKQALGVLKNTAIEQADRSVTDEVAINRLFSERGGKFGAFKATIENRILALNTEERKVQEQIVATKKAENAAALLKLEETKKTIQANKATLEATLAEANVIRDQIRTRRANVIAQSGGARNSIFGALVGARTAGQLGDIAVGDAPRNVGGIRGVVQRFRGVNNTLPSFIDKDPSIAEQRRSSRVSTGLLATGLLLPAITDRLFQTKDPFTQDLKLRQDSISTIRSNINQETGRGATTGLASGAVTASLLGLKSIPAIAAISAVVSGFSALSARIAETTRSITALNAAIIGATKEEREKALKNNLGIFREDKGGISGFAESVTLVAGNPKGFLKDLGASFISGFGERGNVIQTDVDATIERFKNDRGPSLAALSSIKSEFQKLLKEGVDPRAAFERAAEEERSFLTMDAFNSDKLTTQQIDSLAGAVLDGIKPEMEELEKLASKAGVAVKNFNDDFGKSFGVLFEALSGQIDNQISKTRLEAVSLGVNKSFIGDLQGGGSSIDISGISSAVVPLIVSQIKDAVFLGSVGGKRFNEDGVRGVLSRAGISKEAQDPTIGLLLLDKAINNIADSFSKADGRALQGVSPEEAEALGTNMVQMSGLSGVVDRTRQDLENAVGFLDLSGEQAQLFKKAIENFQTAALDQSINLGKPREEISEAFRKSLGLSGNIDENLTKSLGNAFQKIANSAEYAALQLSILSIQTKNEIDSRERFIALSLDTVSRNQARLGTDASLDNVREAFGRAGRTGGIENLGINGILAARTRLGGARDDIGKILGSGFDNTNEENFSALLKLPGVKGDEERQKLLKEAGFELDTTQTGKLIDAIKEYNKASSNAATEQTKFNGSLEKSRQIIPLLAKEIDLLNQRIQDQIQQFSVLSNLNRADRRRLGGAVGQATDILSSPRLGKDIQDILKNSPTTQDALSKLSAEQFRTIQDVVANSVFSSNSVRREDLLSQLEQLPDSSKFKDGGRVGVAAGVFRVAGDPSVDGLQDPRFEELAKDIKDRNDALGQMGVIQSTTNKLLDELNKNLQAVLAGNIFQAPSFAPPGPPVPDMPTPAAPPPSSPPTPPTSPPKPQQEVDERGDPVKPKTKEKKKSEREELSELARALEKAAEEMSASRSKDQEFQKGLVEAIKESFKDPRANAGSIPLATEVNGTVHVDITGVPQRVDAQVAKESLAGFARSLIKSLEGQTDPATQRIVRSIEEALKKISETTKP
jgi:TP901 family phage tail tape measure protein